ncbi:NUDIX hydrolase [Maribacter sp. ACAM166]|uniref:NUDIX hydrolase n=1 Tax=Maribacter sp. ACAM166 TaxID=2508996 RepID=UPI0010FF2402|nr:NUDIX domain-containing protein [Maribacter sp. ACAM166]TLP81241.1 NUDIX domain-containing protein [Maribacter sp. ACAM166]
MDELIDILHANGEPTGVTAMKSEAHQIGLFHATVHIWFYTTDGEILFQKRATTKDVYPRLWDVSVAGHVGAGEPIVGSAIRETREEIGLAITEHKLLKIGVFKSVQKHSEQLIDCEYQHTFLSELKVPLEKLTKQLSEVEDLKLVSINLIEKELTNTEIAAPYVPHSQSYYNTILKKINSLL